MMTVLLLAIALMHDAKPEPMPGAHWLSPEFCEQSFRAQRTLWLPWGTEATATCKSIIDCASSSYQYCAIKGSTVKMGIYVVAKADGDATCQVTCVDGSVGFLRCKDTTTAPSKDDPVCPPDAALCDPCQPLRPACCDDNTCES